MSEREDPSSVGGWLDAVRRDISWFVSCAAIVSLATFLRFFWLGLKPFHHDEGVNGWFLTNLFREGAYRYDPENYHGPTLYYISLAFSKAFGLDTVTVRWSVAVWGVLTVVLALFLRRYIGKIGALFAALFLAISPGMVYISRYFIHEMFFVFLSLAIVVCAAFFIEQRKAGPFALAWAVLLLLVCFFPSTLNIAERLDGSLGIGYTAWGAVFFIVELILVGFIVNMLRAWQRGRPIYLILAAASIALLFATKETAFITLGTLLIAAGCVSIWLRYTTIGSSSADTPEIADEDLSFANARSAFGSGVDRWLMITAAVVAFIYVFVLFFSSFFTYSEGVQKAFEAYAIWTKTGSRDHTAAGFFGYLDWATRIEAPIVVLSVVGTLIAFFRRRDRFAMFTGLWAFGLFLAYSLIPYKTPWLALSFILPACIVGGYAVGRLAAERSRGVKATAAMLAVAASSVLAYQTYELNFVRYDDDSMPYVYAHTRRGFLDLVGEIERYAAANAEGVQVAVDVISPDYWPLVWYLRDYPNAVFHGRMIERSDAEMIVAKKGEQNNEVIRWFSANYRLAGTYPLRPGVDLMLLVRKDIASPSTTELYTLTSR